MIPRSIFLMICILAAAYGTFAIVLRPVLALPLFHPAFAWLVWNAAPPILLAASLYAALKLRQYRLMLKMRALRGAQENLELVRGGWSSAALDHNRGGLELLMEALIVFSTAAIPFWLGLAFPWLWVGLGYITVKMVSALLKK